MFAAPTQDIEAPANAGGFTAPPEDMEDHSYASDVVQNAAKELESLPVSVPTMAKQALGVASIPQDALRAIPEVLAGRKPSETNLAEDVAPIAPGIKNTEQVLAHPVESFRKQPINTAMTGAGLLGLKGSLAEPEAVPSGTKPPPAETIPPLGETPRPEEPRATSSGSTGQPGPEPPPPGASPSGSWAQPMVDKAKEVKDYISRGFQGFSGKPGMPAEIADYVQEKSQMAAMKQMGFTPNQMRQLGKTPLESQNSARAIGQYAYDKGIVSPTTGLKGMLEKNAELTKSSGKAIGDFRAQADKIAGAIDPKEVAKAVRAALDKKYMRGVTPENPSPRGAYSGQAGAYLKAIQEVEDAEGSHSGIADAATELNHAANKAAKNQQPETPFTDVANEVSRINNERIKALLGPEKAAQYEQALREFGVNKKIANGLKFKSSGEAKRFGPGSFTSNSIQKGMDELGYRVGGKALNKMSTSLLHNPAITKSLPSLFKEFINQVEDVGHDVTGMSEGGLVTPDVEEWVKNK